MTDQPPPPDTPSTSLDQGADLDRSQSTPSVEVASDNILAEQESPSLSVGSKTSQHEPGLPTGAHSPFPIPHSPVLPIYRRPFAVGFYFAYRALIAFVIATPVSVAIAGLFGRYPRGDALLFDQGGLMLVEAVRLLRAAITPFVVQSSLLTVLASMIGLVPFAVLVIALGQSGRFGHRDIIHRVMGSMGTLVLVWGVAIFAEVVAFILMFFLGSKLVLLLSADPRVQDIASLVALGTALVVVAAIGVIHDIARIAIVDQQRGFYMAVSAALRTVGKAPLRVAYAYIWRGLLSLVVLGYAIALVQRSGTASSGRVALAFGIHQTALLVVVCLRASWLGAAMRLLRRTVVQSET